MNISRRTALLGLATSFSLGGTTLALGSASTDKRLVVVILRGALDGMAAVVPYGDPGLVVLRGEIAPPAPGQPDGLLDLGGFYGLHPSLAGVHDMYVAGEVVPVHAVAGSVPRAQPFRGAGLPGVRCGSPDDQRLAQPRDCRAAGRRDFATGRGGAGGRNVGPAAAARPGAGGELGAAWFLPAGAGPVCDDRGVEPGR